MQILNGRILNLRRKDKLGFSGGIFIVKPSQDIKGKFKLRIKLQAPWKTDLNATLVFSQKIQGEVKKEKFSLVHSEEELIALTDQQLPERVEFQAYFDKKNVTVHRLLVNKFMKDSLLINIKPVIPKDVEFQVLLQGENLTEDTQDWKFKPFLLKVVSRPLSVQEHEDYLKKLKAERYQANHPGMKVLKTGQIVRESYQTQPEEEKIDQPGQDQGDDAK